MPSLPDRPLALDRRFVAAQGAAIAVPVLALVALGSTALALTAEDLARLSTQEEVLASGVQAERPRVDIERDVSLFVFRARRYEIDFADREGHTHHVRVREHDVSVAPLVVTGPPEVHYDPHDPTRVAVGFARQNVGAQYAAIVLLGAIGVALFGLAGWAFTRVSRTLRRARAASLQLTTTSARVTALERFHDSRGEPTGELRLVLALEQRSHEARDTYREHGEPAQIATVSARSRRLDLVTPAGDPPIFLDAVGSRVLVVRTASGEPVLVRRSGHPFALDASERDALTSGTFEPPPAARPAADVTLA